MKKILYLSQSNIVDDSRIIKYMKIATKTGFKTRGFGVTRKYYGLKEKIKDKKIKLLNLGFIKPLPKVLKNIFEPIAFFFSFFLPALNYRPSIVHCNDVTPLPLAVACKIFLNSKIIYDAHELESNKNGISPFLSILVLTLEKIFWKKIDFFITVSLSIQKWYLDRLGPKKSQVIYNSPEIEPWKNNKQNILKQKFNLPKRSKILVYSGVIGFGRGLEPFFKYFLNNKGHVHFVLLGYWEQKFYDKFFCKIKSSKNIHFFKAVKPSKVCKVLSCADYGLCTIENVSLSDYYCMPNKLFEYAFSKIKIIGSKFPEIEKFLKQTKIGFCIHNQENVKSILLNIQKFKVNKKRFPLKQYSFLEQQKKIKLIYQLL